MAEKKAKAEKPKIEIQTRKPEKKRGIFANIGNDREKNEHPLREILKLPDPPTSDIRTINNEIAKNDDHGYPNEYVLDIQYENHDHPKLPVLDIQNREFGYPKPHTLDNQNEIFGNPKATNLDSLISKNEKRISKTKGGLDSNIANAESLDSQTDEKKTDWQKYDKKRKAKGVFLRTNDEITKKFKQFCIAQDWDFSQGTEIAWNKLMTDLAIQTPGDLDSLIAQDDRRLKMLFKSKPIIINLYLRYNSIFNELAEGSAGKKWTARWSPRDDEAAVRYNEVPPALIELGILQTQVQKGIGSSRIQTFKYYTDEIEKVLASGVSDEMLDTILKYHRQLWKNQTGREVDLSFLDG